MNEDFFDEKNDFNDISKNNNVPNSEEKFIDIIENKNNLEDENIIRIDSNEDVNFVSGKISEKDKISFLKYISCNSNVNYIKICNLMMEENGDNITYICDHKFHYICVDIFRCENIDFFRKN